MPQDGRQANHPLSLSALRYRLALDLGPASLGWAMVRLDPTGTPCAVIRAGVRIFSDGRNPTDGSSLAVTRRNARAARRRRDRFLRRQARLIEALVDLGFFPAAVEDRKALERLNPYAYLDQALSDSRGKQPCAVLMRPSHRPWTILMRLDDLPRFVEEYLRARAGVQPQAPADQAEAV